MTDMNKIADKIQKLLALSGNNPSEDEAQAALLMAQRLMAKYNINQEDLGGEEKISYSLELVKVKTNPRSKRLCMIIANSFAVKAILCSNRIHYFGRKMNVDAAKSALEYSHRVMERGMTKACRDKGLSGTEQAGASLIYNAYADGFMSGLQEAMAAQTKALAIVVPEDVNKAFNEKFPDLRAGRAIHMRYSRDNIDSYAQGFSDGKRVMDKRSLTAGA